MQKSTESAFLHVILTYTFVVPAHQVSSLDIF